MFKLGENGKEWHYVFPLAFVPHFSASLILCDSEYIMKANVLAIYAITEKYLRALDGNILIKYFLEYSEKF